MPEKLKIMFLPVDGLGHFNACFGVASVLRDRGHLVTFVAPAKWEGKLEAMGYREELYTISDEPVRLDENVGEIWGNMLEGVVPALCSSPIDVLEAFYLPMWEKIIEQFEYAHEQFKAIVSRVKPDVMVLDFFCHNPALMDTGIPWISSISIAPLGISRDNVPPPYTGYATEGDREEWRRWECTVAKVFAPLNSRVNQWLVKEGSEAVEFKFPYMMKHSPYANMYMYPIELDYAAFRPNPPNFYRFDAFVREENEKFQIPHKLKNGPGKLIYFSMGTIGSAEIGLMKRLISMLSNSPNRFIISKGPRGEEITLGDNMWGENSVPQLSIIPMVDLVITHGGNNTITESFHFGKRVLVLPLLFDQLDNAQRICETGLGLQFHPYKVSEEDLLVAIEMLLDDDLLERRMETISKRIQAANSQCKAADLVENIALKYKK